jgi:phasin family protein
MLHRSKRRCVLDQPGPNPGKRRRKATATVIEAAAVDGPMPIVEPAEPDTTAEPEPATPTAAVSADPQIEDMTMDTETVTQTAETNTRTATNAAESIFADAQARTTGAMDKGAKLVEELAQFNKGNLEAIVESGKIAARGFESLGQDVAAFAKQSFEQQSAAWRTLGTVKSPTEFMKLQGELIRQSFDQLVQQGSRQTETMLKLAGEVAQPLSNRVAVAAEKIKVAA